MAKSRIFSGDYSRDMWDAINNAKSKDDIKGALYLIGCRLQEFESRVENMEKCPTDYHKYCIEVLNHNYCPNCGIRLK